MESRKLGVKHMEKIKERLPKILETIIPIIIFVILILVATVYDLQISKALVNGLKPGKYYTTNFVAKLVEIGGSFPIWGMTFFGCLILYRVTYLREDKWKYLQYVFALGAVGVAAIFCRDCFKYYYRYEGSEHLLNKFDMLLIYGLFGLFCAFLGLVFIRKLNDDHANKFLRMTFVIIGSCAFYLLIEIIKGPAGRIRFRAMNQLDDFSIFMPWYKFGNKSIPNIGELKEMLPSDAFKSFPSGHTFSASMIFNLLCLPSLFKKFDNMKWKTIIYSGCILYVVFVGLFRIIAGAHFLSDITFGGFIGYTAVRFFKYLFIDRKNRLEKTQ